MLDVSALAEFPALETARLRLREFTPEDAAAVLRIMARPEVTRYFGCLPMTTIEQARERVDGIRRDFQARAGVRWALTSRDTGEFLGSAGFWRLLPEHARAEVGYELAPEWWGRGVMTEALAAMLEFGFGQLRLHSVEAQIHPANAASRRVLEKLGFVQEGYFRENVRDPVEGCFVDTAVFSLLARDWGARQPASL